MQNSTTLPQEENLNAVLKTAIKIFSVRLNLVWKLLTTSRAIVIVDNQPHVFNFNELEVMSICVKLAANTSQSLSKENKIKTPVRVHEVCLN